jgi:hypothetical protein
MRAPFSTAVAISVGLIILAGYFVPLPLLADLQSTLLGWAIILGAFAALVGLTNLVLTHWRKATSKVKAQRDPYSLLLLVAFVATLAAGLWFGPADPVMQQVIMSIQVPVEASLMAALAFALGYASLKLMRRRQGGMAVIFVISALVFLVLLSGFLTSVNVPLVQDILVFLDHLPVAGVRGILLGIALGGLVTGLRILLGADRPYSG